MSMITNGKIFAAVSAPVCVACLHASNRNDVLAVLEVSSLAQEMYALYANAFSDVSQSRHTC